MGISSSWFDLFVGQPEENYGSSLPSEHGINRVSQV
jgi:hypothetical protein